MVENGLDPGCARRTFPLMNPQIPYSRPEQSTTGLFPNAYDSLTARISKLEARILAPVNGAHGWTPDRKFDNLLPVASDNLWDRVAKAEQRILTPVAGHPPANRFSPFPMSFTTLLPENGDTPEIRVAKLEQRI